MLLSRNERMGMADASGVTLMCALLTVGIDTAARAAGPAATNPAAVVPTTSAERRAFASAATWERLGHRASTGRGDGRRGGLPSPRRRLSRSASSSGGAVDSAARRPRRGHGNRLAPGPRGSRSACQQCRACLPEIIVPMQTKTKSSMPFPLSPPGYLRLVISASVSLPYVCRGCRGAPLKRTFSGPFCDWQLAQI